MGAFFKTTYMQNAIKGFTLIELLIVIAILGILAAALGAVLKPGEQIARAKDSGLQVGSKAIYDAVNRFYAQQGYYPQCVSASGTCTDISAGTAANLSGWIGTGTVSAPQTSSPQGRLELTNELKAGYLSGVSAPGSIIMSAANVAAPGAAVVVCFVPTSAAYLAQATYNSTGGAGTTHICLK